ncbi:MAG: hypothetical protein ACJAS9_002144 [Polaribacter sp.]|jgi:hypothetical protein
MKLENFVLHTAESKSFGMDIKLLLKLIKKLREEYPKPIRLLRIGVKFLDKFNQSSSQN